MFRWSVMITINCMGIVIYTWIFSCIVGCLQDDVRLVQGHTSYEGRVEICINNNWRAICGSNWQNVDARVVCRQLGLPVTGD